MCVCVRAAIVMCVCVCAAIVCAALSYLFSSSAKKFLSSSPLGLSEELILASSHRSLSSASIANCSKQLFEALLSYKLFTSYLVNIM